MLQRVYTSFFLYSCIPDLSFGNLLPNSCFCIRVSQTAYVLSLNDLNLIIPCHRVAHDADSIHVRHKTWYPQLSFRHGQFIIASHSSVQSNSSEVFPNSLQRNNLSSQALPRPHKVQINQPIRPPRFSKTYLHM